MITIAPRRVRHLEDQIRERVVAILDQLKDADAYDFVTDIAAELPIQMLAELLCIPQADRNKLFQWSNALISRPRASLLLPPRFGARYCGFRQPFANNESAAACTAVPLKKSRFLEVQNSTALVKTMSRNASSLMTPCSTSS
jgi:cytochrome P450